MSTSLCRSPMPAQSQRGVVLFISLIVLVAMTLAGIALFRQVGTGVAIAGNLAFKDSATSAGDLGIESARAWLITQGSATLQGDLSPAYCSSWQVFFDPITHGWTGTANCSALSATSPGGGSQLVIADDGAGNEIRYIVHRLCSLSGALNVGGQQCATLGAAGAGGSKGGGAYGVLPLANTMQPYFRITVRSAGPRNTVSYVQAIMY